MNFSEGTKKSLRISYAHSLMSLSWLNYFDDYLAKQKVWQDIDSEDISLLTFRETRSLLKQP